MAGIRQQGEGVREQAKDNFQDDEAAIEENSDQECSPKIGRRMMLMAMFVMVVAHEQSAP